MLTGDVPRVDGQLAVARAFGDKSLKRHLSSEPDVAVEIVDDDTEFIILASDGLWKVSHSLKLTSYLCYFFHLGGHLPRSKLGFDFHSQ